MAVEPAKQPVITGIGMVSSLGPDAALSCAAARAGLLRIRELDYMVDNPEEFEMVACNGHTVDELTQGFMDIGRLVRLGSFGLQDLFTSADVTPEDMPRAGMVLNLASGTYHDQLRKQRQASEEPGEPGGEDAGDVDVPPYPSAMHETIIAKVLQAVDCEAKPAQQETIFGDQPGAALAIDKAVEWLRAGSVDSVIIGGVDSLVDGPVLSILHELGLLKKPDAAEGIIPGEGAAFVRLELRQPAEARGAAILGTVGNTAYGRETGDRFGDTAPQGRALADVIRDSLQGVRDCRTAYCCVNGDTPRFTEWGLALVSLRGQEMALPELVVPAESFGETGAAYGFFGVCMALRSFARGYNASDSVAIWSAADSGERASFALVKG